MPPKSVAEILHDDWTGWEEREAFRKAKPLIKLRANQCRWPVLDAPDVPGGFLFCAEAVDNKGWPYCRHHYGRARA
jgi:hypothetical protein